MLALRPASRFGLLTTRLTLSALTLTVLALLPSCGGETPVTAGKSDTGGDLGALADAGADTARSGPTCAADSDCAAPLAVCDPLVKQCVACLYDADCGAGSRCQAKACVPFKTCSNSLDCKGVLGPSGAEQAVCDQAIGECVECAGNDDCPASSECLAKRCVAYVACGNSSDCPANQVCDPASKRCAECAAAEDCPADHSCEAGKCKAFTTCSSDKQCTPQGLLCDKAKGKCAQCLSHADCPGVYHCVPSGPAGTGECKLDVCKAGAGACQDNSKVACNAEGSGFGAPEKCGEQTTCAVDGGAPACKPWLCQAGFSCVGDKAVQCRGDGLEVLAEIDCAASGQTCQGGECKTLLCKPNQAYCDGNAVKLCNATGLGSAVQKTCGAKEYCDAGACKAGVCAPDQPVCDGNGAKVCNAQGSAFQGPGKDCGSSAVCVSGACLPKVCPAGGSFCEGNVVKVCDSLGVSASAQKTCGPGEFCNDGACKAQVCAPNQPACDGNVAKVCNAQGSGYTGTSTDCAGKKCIGGVCTALVCPPATQFCEGGKLKTCSPDGLSVVADQACATGSFCGLNKSGDAACLPWVCEPGKATCNGTVATTCKADGSGYQDAGTECKVQGKVCSAGVCKALLCDPQAPSYCDQNTAMKCDATGLNPSVVQVCGSTQFCDKGTCQAQVCSPGKPGCFGELASTCNANGSGYLAGGTDCKAAGKSCSGGVCINSYASCKAVLGANPAATDGLYPIDPDGAGPIAPANLFCDMKNGGLTLVANVYDSAGDDAPNSTEYVVSGWQQTGSGKWDAKASTVDRAWGGNTGSAAVSLAFVAALKASAGQQNLKMCFVHKDGYDTTCRDSSDGSLTLVSYATGNPKLTVYSADKLTYTFGRLAGLAGTADGYDASKYGVGAAVVPIKPGVTDDGQFGGAGKLAEYSNNWDPNWNANEAIWHAAGGGVGYRPWHIDISELGAVIAGETVAGFRLYIGPQPVCGNGTKETGEGCDDGNTAAGDGCSAMCKVEGGWTLVKSESLAVNPAGAVVENGGFSGQGVGQIGGRTAWVQNSDWNGLFVPDGLDPKAAGWAVEVDMWRPAADRSAGVSLRVVHAWKGGANVQSGGSCSDDGFYGVSCGFSSNWVGTLLGTKLTNSSVGAWRTYRIEYTVATMTMTGYADGKLLGSWKVDPNVMVGGYVDLGGGAPCCQPAQIGFSNLKTYQAN